MEIIPFLIFGVIAFNIFRSFTKAASKSGETSRDIMAKMHKQIQEANSSGNSTPNMSRYRDKTPTQRGRESMARKGEGSPWNHEHDLGGNKTVSPGARVAANYLSKTKASRRASHKNAEQHGRRGINKDQNRSRTDEWGERGDKGLLSGKTLVILLVIGGSILYWLSRTPAA